MNQGFLRNVLGIMRVFYVSEGVLKIKSKENETLEESLKVSGIIPSTHNRKELIEALEKTQVQWIMLKLGDINTLPRLVEIIHQFGKKVMVHQDSIRGIARDRMGIQYMANVGVDAIITMKPLCLKMIKEAGKKAIFGFFMIDSDALKTGIQNIEEHHPDGVIIMPGTIPKELIEKMIKVAGVPVILGGLISNKEQIDEVMETGILGIATSQPELWII
ncbi:MAG: glycerol-3-phosphate responsive antiterminator [Eubacteriaceae bacterium]